MGLFASFMFRGFETNQLYLYSPGTLYEINAGLGVTLKPIEMRSKVETLLGGWAGDEDTFRELGQKMPVYALELHGINDKQSPNNGYGTYIYLPDEKNLTSIPGIKSAFSSPNELYDDEDPLKILSATYADTDGFPNGSDGSPVIYDMKLRMDDYYPIRYWERADGSDPLDEIFGVFENLGPGEYGGISLVLAPPSREWFKSGRARIREIEDPNYIGKAEDLKFTDLVSKIVKSEDLPGEGVDRMVYERQRIDDSERLEINEIRRKCETNIDHFRCTLRVYGSSDKIAKTIADIITQKSGGRYNRIEIADKNGNLVKLATRSEGRHRFVLSAQEIPMIWHVVSDGGNNNSNKIHKAVPDAMIPPDELITIDVGAPGDIQKLIYSINENEKKRSSVQKVVNQNLIECNSNSANDSNCSSDMTDNYSDNYCSMRHPEERNDARDVIDDDVSDAFDNNDGNVIIIDNIDDISPLLSVQYSGNDIATHEHPASLETEVDNNLFNASEEFVDAFDGFVNTIRETNKAKRRTREIVEHRRAEKRNDSDSRNVKSNPFIDLENDLFGDSE